MQAGKAVVLAHYRAWNPLERLEAIDEHDWTAMAEHFEGKFKGLIGGAEQTAGLPASALNTATVLGSVCAKKSLADLRRCG